MSTSEIVLEETPYLNLTTRGRKTGLKHDVELWFAFEDGKLYFLAHESSHWWKNVIKTPRDQVERWYGGERSKRKAIEIQLGRVLGKKPSGKGSLIEIAI